MEDKIRKPPSLKEVYWDEPTDLEEEYKALEQVDINEQNEDKDETL